MQRSQQLRAHSKHRLQLVLWLPLRHCACIQPLCQAAAVSSAPPTAAVSSSAVAARGPPLPCARFTDAFRSAHSLAHAAAAAWRLRKNGAEKLRRSKQAHFFNELRREQQSRGGCSNWRQSARSLSPSASSVGGRPRRLGEWEGSTAGERRWDCSSRSCTAFGDRLTGFDDPTSKHFMSRLQALPSSPLVPQRCSLPPAEKSPQASSLLTLAVRSLSLATCQWTADSPLRPSFCGANRSSVTDAAFSGSSHRFCFGLCRSSLSPFPPSRSCSGLSAATARMQACVSPRAASTAKVVPCCAQSVTETCTNLLEWPTIDDRQSPACSQPHPSPLQDRSLRQRLQPRWMRPRPLSPRLAQIRTRRSTAYVAVSTTGGQ